MTRVNRLNVFYHGRKVERWLYGKECWRPFSTTKTGLLTDFPSARFPCPWKQKYSSPDQIHLTVCLEFLRTAFRMDGGVLLVDRLMLKNHRNPYELGNLDRLSIVGKSGMGALCYEPDISLEQEQRVSDLDELAQKCREILNSDTVENLDELFRLGGSSGGARPKNTDQNKGRGLDYKIPISS